MAATITNQINATIASVLSSSPSIAPTPIPRPDTLKGIDDLILAGFEAYRGSCFNWLLKATGLVVAGLALEGPELWHEITWIVRQWRFKRRFHFCFPEDHAPNWVKLAAFVGWLFIVVGVAGEYVADSFVSKADGYVQTFDEILLHESQTRTAFANERASAAFERAAQTEKEAAQDLKTTAQLKKDAEDERLARAKIEAAVGWRSLSDQQKRDIGAALAGFSPRAGASMLFNASSIEAEMFADDIAEALRFGHITTTAPGGIMKMPASGEWNGKIISAETGVVIQCTRAPAAIEFAEALIKELNSRGFDTKRQTDPPFDDRTIEAVIWVNVEPRPKGPQGEYKLQAERDAKAKKATSTSTTR